MKTLYYLGSLVAFLSFLSVFISLYNSLKERKYELALIRTMGGSRRHLFLLIILEGFILSAIGFMIGIALSRTGLLIVSNRLEENFQYSIGELGMLSMEWILLVATLLIGVLASFLPALSAMRMDISKTLQDA